MRWTKRLELAKVVRRDGQRFDCATCLRKARALPKEDFRREVEKELIGKEEEPLELIYDSGRCRRITFSRRGAASQSRAIRCL